MAVTAMRIDIPSDILKQVTAIAERRNAENRAAGQADGLVAKHNKSSVDADVEGALGEYAVATALQLDWDGAFKSYEAWQQWRTDGHDVSGLEVRTTTYPNGRLIVQPSNKNDVPYILVVVARDYSHAVIKGWRWGRDVKNADHWQSHWPRPTFAMPQSLLYPIDTLRDLWNATWWLSTERMTGAARVVNGRVHAADSAPIFKRFDGQPLANLVNWLRKQPGFKGEVIPRDAA